MELKDYLIKTLNFRYVVDTKWNTIYKNNEYTLIYNKLQKTIKIKNNEKRKI